MRYARKWLAGPLVVCGICALLVTSACSSGDSDNGEANSLNPVLQISFLFDVVTNAFQGALTGASELSDSFSEQAYDPDGGEIVSYQWDFGDGSTSTDKEPVHTYVSTGKYEAILTATDDEGNSCDSLMTVVVSSEDENDPPAVRVQASTLTALTGLENSISFRAVTEDPEGDSLTYLWDFGDGTSSSEKNPTHSYGAAGEYQPSVTVTDANGASSSAHICLLVLPVLEEEDTTTFSPFSISCDPNPGVFSFEVDTSVTVAVSLGPGTPDTWSVRTGAPAGVSTDEQVWSIVANGFAIPWGPADPPRVEYYPVLIEAKNDTSIEQINCDVWLFYFGAGGGGGGPPPGGGGEIDIEGFRIEVAAPGTVQSGDTLKMGVRVVDVFGLPPEGRFQIGLGEPPGDPTAPQASGDLDEVGRVNLESTQVFWPAGEATVYGSFDNQTFTLTTVTVE